MDLTGIQISDFMFVVIAVPSIAGIKRLVVAVVTWRKKRRARAQLPLGSN